MAKQRICSIGGCGKPAVSSGLCNGHRHRLRRYGDKLFYPERINSGTCSVPGCAAAAKTKGWCRKHYGRWQRNGSPVGGKTAFGVPLNWLLDHMHHTDNDCLLWSYGGARYGKVRFRGCDRSAHRVMCVLAHGSPPDDNYEAAHSCGNGENACVNPRHLSWKTKTDNQADRRIHGTDCRGERHPMAKLTESDVRAIRTMRWKATIKVTAERFNVSVATIKAIYAKRIWGWLK